MTVGVEVEDVAIPLAGEVGRRGLLRIYRSAPGCLPVVVYLPGLAGEASTDALARCLAVRLTAAVVIPEGSAEPGEPTLLECAGAAVAWLTEQGQRPGLDHARVAIFGEGLGALSARRLARGASQTVSVGEYPVVCSPTVVPSPADRDLAGSEDESQQRLVTVISELRVALVQGKAQGISG